MTRFDELYAKALSGNWTLAECNELEKLVFAMPKKTVIHVLAEDLEHIESITLPDGREVRISFEGGI